MDYNEQCNASDSIGRSVAATLGTNTINTVKNKSGNPLDKKKKIDANLQYQVVSEGIYSIAGQTTMELPAGCYAIMIRDGSPFFIEKNVKSDDWISFEEGLFTQITNEIEDFWNKKEIYAEYGFLQRRGIIFHGPQGSGKSVFLKQVMAKMIEDGGLVFMCTGDTSHIISGIQQIRRLEPERKIAVIFEDIDTIIQQQGEQNLLTYLDGEDSVNHILNLATTNYPERLNPRIIQRPRRFDRVVFVGFPDEKVRREYFTKKLNLNEKEAKEWAKKTDKFSFASCAELVISVKCLGYQLDKAIEVISDLMESKPDSKNQFKDWDTGKTMGFKDTSSDTKSEIVMEPVELVAEETKPQIGFGG